MDPEDQERQEELLASIPEKKKAKPNPADAFMSQFSGTIDSSSALQTIAKSSDESKLRLKQEQDEKMAIAFSYWYCNARIMHQRNWLTKEMAFPTHLLENVGILEQMFRKPVYGHVKKATYDCPEPAKGTLRQKNYPNLKEGDFVLSDATVISVQIPLRVVCFNNHRLVKGWNPDAITVIPEQLHAYMHNIAPGLSLHASRDVYGRPTDAKVRFKEFLGYKGLCVCAMGCGASWGALETYEGAVVHSADAHAFVIDGLDDKLEDHARTALDNAWGSAGMAGPAFGRQSFARKKWEYEKQVVRIICNKCNAKRTYRPGGALGTTGSRVK